MLNYVIGSHDRKFENLDYCIWFRNVHTRCLTNSRFVNFEEMQKGFRQQRVRILAGLTEALVLLEALNSFTSLIKQSFYSDRVDSAAVVVLFESVKTTIIIGPF